MELCNIAAATTTTSALLHRHYNLLSTSTKSHHRFNTLLHRSSTTRSVSGKRNLIGTLLISAGSKDYSVRTRCSNEDRTAVTTVGDALKAEKTAHVETAQTDILEDDTPVDVQSQGLDLVDNLNIHVETAQTDILEDDAPVDVQSQGLDLLDNLNIQVESADASSIILLGGGAVVSLWLAASIVGAIDSIPIFPKLMEVIGLAYTIWFSTRYLLFKKNRDELVMKIDEIKQQVLGSIDE